MHKNENKKNPLKGILNVWWKRHKSKTVTEDKGECNFRPRLYLALISIIDFSVVWDWRDKALKKGFHCTESNSRVTPQRNSRWPFQMPPVSESKKCEWDTTCDTLKTT